MTEPRPRLPLPVPQPESDHYWERARAHELWVMHCDDCGQSYFYPRAICPFCFSTNVKWTEAKGTGTIYTCSVTRRAGPIPYCLAYVQLDEGPRMLTNIVDCDLDAVRIGQQVKVAFKKTVGGVTLPMFTPA